MVGSFNTFNSLQVRSTTSYYQIAVNLPATYYGNVTVALTVRHDVQPGLVWSWLGVRRRLATDATQSAQLRMPLRCR